jgi:hypothetical protein
MVRRDKITFWVRKYGPLVMKKDLTVASVTKQENRLPCTLGSIRTNKINFWYLYKIICKMGYKYISCNTQHVSGETYCSLTESQSESYAEESTMQHT